ncbi:uroporphyrinogen-III synthase [Legionella erythra]|uniref:Uroporphyrinogen-III synthase n=1 Tax=Legionella erythra TaxID=448 RepID=A0A0W0TQE6_LEGER|nr:uroporphyrinogen-III synthase [Legionella erythra]KTC97820.1 uroporphyrinogen-III synthase [Legionella erythra]
MNTSDLPLRDKRIVLLRSKEKSKKIVERIEALGGVVLFQPVLDLVPTATLKTLTPEWLSAYDTIIFASANAVDFFLKQLKQYVISPVSLLNGKCIIPVGQETANYLLSLQIKPSLVPKSYSQEGIIEALPLDLRSKKILLPNNLDSRKYLEEELIKRQAQVTALPIYQSVPVIKKTTLNLKNDDFVVFSSSLIAKFFFENQDNIPKIRPVAIGPSTYNTIHEYFQGEILLAEESSLMGTIEIILASCSQSMR